MFDKVDKGEFEFVDFVNPAEEFGFKKEWWEDDDFLNHDKWVKKISGHVFGFAKLADTEPKYAVMCVGKKGNLVAFTATSKRFKVIKRWMQHVVEREQNGVSFRDAWNIDTWLADKVSTALALLDKNSCSYPTNALELHDKFVEIDKSMPPYPEDENKDEDAKLKHDDLCVKKYHEDLNRMKFLFSQYDEDKCVEKNQYKFCLRMVHGKPDDKGCSTLDFVGTDEQKAETDRWRQRYNEIDEYRTNCLKKALLMLELYIMYLWD